MAKSMAHAQLVLLIQRKIPQKMIEKAKDEIRETYTSRKQCLDFPETKKGRKGPDTFARRMGGVCSWQVGKRIPLLLIQTFIRKGQNRKIEANSAISVINPQFS